MSKVLQNAPVEHSEILSTCTKLPHVFKTFVLLIFEWPLKTGSTVNVFFMAQPLKVQYSSLFLSRIIGKVEKTQSITQK